jgi:hypothetical protein
MIESITTIKVNDILFINIKIDSDTIILNSITHKEFFAQLAELVGKTTGLVL